MKPKSKFYAILEKALKEADSYDTNPAGTNTSANSSAETPDQAAQAGQVAATAAQTAGVDQQKAINTANQAFLAALKNHPTLKGNPANITPEFLKTLAATKTI